MSFKDNRVRRMAKEAKSYVGSSSNPSGTDPTTEDITLAPAPLYSTLPPSVEVRTSQESGRGIYAKESLKKGSIVFGYKPPVYVLSTRYLEAFCSSCIAPAPAGGLKRCTLCKNLWYCNAVCQNNDWALHKKECDAMQRWAAGAPSLDVAIPAEPIRCLGRVLWGRRKHGLNSVWTREMDAMKSHRTSLPPEAAESHTHLAHAVIRYLGLTAPEELVPFGINNAAGIVDLISRFTTNSITLTSSSLTPLGVCVSPSIALINHSCKPNAVVVFPRATKDHSTQEPEAQVIAIRDIAPDEEIFTSYIDTTLPRAHRLAALSATYNFACKCVLCSNPPTWDLREVIGCPTICGGTCPFPTEENPLTRCVKCKSVLATADDVLDALQLGQEALQKATSLQFSDMRKAKQLTANVIPLLTSLLVLGTSHPLLALTRLHQSLLLASLPPVLTHDTLDELLRDSHKNTGALYGLFPSGHPVLALALAEHGKLLAMDEPEPRTATGANKSRDPPFGPERLRLACGTLINARDQLVIGFGERNGGGEVGREVREMVVRIERELAAWDQGIRNVIEDTPSQKK